MKIRNPSGRRLPLEILANAGDNVALTLELGPHTTVDLDRYQRALDAMDEAEAAVARIEARAGEVSPDD